MEEDPIFEILSKASRAQCVAISEEYMETFKMTLSSALKKKFGGNIGKLLLLWIQPIDFAVASLIKNACSKLITNTVAIIRIITKYDKPFLAQVDQACFKLFGSNLITILGKALTGNVYKAIRGWLEYPTPDNGTENELDEYIHIKQSAGLSNSDIFNDPDCVDNVKELLRKRSEAFGNYMREQNIKFEFNDHNMAVLHESANSEHINRRRNTETRKRPSTSAPSPTHKGQQHIKYMKVGENVELYDEKAKKVSDYLIKEFSKFDDDQLGEFVTEDFWYIVKTLPLTDLGLSVEEVDFMSTHCEWEVDGHINYLESIGELTDGLVHAIEAKPSENDVFSVIKRLEHEDMVAQKRQSHVNMENGKSDSHKKKNKKAKKEKHKLPPNVANFIFDTIESFDYDCKGFLNPFEMDKFIDAVNIQLSITIFYTTVEDVYTYDDICKVFAKEIDKVLESNSEPMYLCFMDKQSGAFFWYNVLDASTKWVTENEFGESSSRRYNTSQHVTQQVHYLPLDEYDDTPYLLHSDIQPVSEVQTQIVQEDVSNHLSDSERINGKKALTLWLTEGAKVSPPEVVDTYAELLVTEGMISAADIGSRIEKNSNVLQSLGISNANVAKIQQALIKAKANQLSLQTTGISSVRIDMVQTPQAINQRPPELPEAVKEKEENIDEKDLCLICFENRKCMVFFPCGHLCVCEPCDAMMNRKQGVLCIMCRVEIQNRAKLFTT